MTQIKLIEIDLGQLKIQKLIVFIFKKLDNKGGLNSKPT